MDEVLRYTQIIGFTWKWWDTHILALEYVLFLSIIQSFQATSIFLLPFPYFKAVEDVYEQSMVETALHVLECDIKLKIESCRSDALS